MLIIRNKKDEVIYFRSKKYKGYLKTKSKIFPVIDFKVKICV